MGRRNGRSPALVGPGVGPGMLGVVAALAYGLMGEIAFQNVRDILMGTLSISFLFFLPIGIGALAVRFGPDDLKESWPYGIFAPWAVCTLFGIVIALVAMEAWVCVVIGLPLFWAMSSVGGALMVWRYRRRTADPRTGGDTALLGALLLAPYLLMPLEAQWAQGTMYRTVERAVVIAADAETVWNEFVAVPAIQPEEEPFAWFRLLGLPDPVEAMLTAPGTGGMRQASYDNGMRVLEPVTVWEPYRRYRFAVELDPTSAQPSPLWMAVAGEHLRVEAVEYRIEPLADGEVRLHLASSYQLTTPVNAYAGLWLDFLLGDFEGYILQIVKGRAEAASLD